LAQPIMKSAQWDIPITHYNLHWFLRNLAGNITKSEIRHRIGRHSWVWHVQNSMLWCAGECIYLL